MLVVSVVALTAGLGLAWHHPLSRLAASALFAASVIVGACHRRLWLFVVPAALPLLNFSPWTGWICFDEFDLLLVGVIAGGFARLAGAPVAATADARTGVQPRCATMGTGFALAFGLLAMLSLARGIADAGGWTFAWFDGYAQALNSVRVVKSAVFALALWPLLREQSIDSAPVALSYFARGMQVGLAIVGMAALAERAAYPGLLNFSTRYRTTALFWEMHVGGGAIDAYLAMATPFAAWAVWSARSRRAWTAAAGLALLTIHACLTTFSRGVYLAVAAPLFLLGAAWWWRRFGSSSTGQTLRPWAVLVVSGLSAALLILSLALLGGIGLVGVAVLLVLLAVIWGMRFRRLRWRQTAAFALMVGAMTETIGVVGGGSFMLSRIEASERDFGARAAHWGHGLDLMRSAPDWLVGIGVGRLPARYARAVPGGEFSGASALLTSRDGHEVARISGPPTDETIAGLYSLTQPVALGAPEQYHLGLVLRVAEATKLAVDFCEQHLLYERLCQGRLINVEPHDGAWQSIATTLHGPPLSRGPWYAPRSGVLSLSVNNVGAQVDLRRVSLSGPNAREALSNGDFSRGLEHWLPLAQFYFLPWHIDNLFLELLIERGALGLIVFLILLGCSFCVLLAQGSRNSGITPFLASSLLGALFIGCLNSIMDVPRVAFLLLMLLLVSLQLKDSSRASARGDDQIPSRRADDQDAVA
jgi:hypothetical protein